MSKAKEEISLQEKLNFAIAKSIAKRKFATTKEEEFHRR